MGHLYRCRASGVPMPHGRQIGQPAAHSFVVTRSTMTPGRDIISALNAVVFDSHLPLAPTHVDANERVSVLVEEFDLRLRPRQSRADEGQPESRFLRRFRPAVDEVEHFPHVADATDTRPRRGDCAHDSRRTTRGIEQRIDDRDRNDRGSGAADVEGGASRSGHPHPAHDADVVGLQAPRVGHHARTVMSIGTDDFGRVVRGEPSSAEDGGSGHARQRDVRTRREPRGPRLDRRRHLRLPVDVHVAEDAAVAPTQVVAGHNASADGIAAAKRHGGHGRSVRPRADGFGRRGAADRGPCAWIRAWGCAYAPRSAGTKKPGPANGTGPFLVKGT